MSYTIANGTIPQSSWWERRRVEATPSFGRLCMRMTGQTLWPLALATMQVGRKHQAMPTCAPAGECGKRVILKWLWRVKVANHNSAPQPERSKQAPATTVRAKWERPALLRLMAHDFAVGRRLAGLQTRCRVRRRKTLDVCQCKVQIPSGDDGEFLSRWQKLSLSKAVSTDDAAWTCEGPGSLS